MATRSLIGKQNQDGSISYIYCHYDGYPSNNGVILQEHYTTPFKVDQLLALGDLSILGTEVGEQHDFNNRTRGWCLAYGRDRGESSTEMTTVSRDEFFEQDRGVDYLYLYNNDFEWECYNAWESTPEEIPALDMAV